MINYGKHDQTSKNDQKVRSTIKSLVLDQKSIILELCTNNLFLSK